MLFVVIFFQTDNEIGDDGAKAIAEALKTNKTLRDLSLSGKSISHTHFFYSLIYVWSVLIILSRSFLECFVFFNSFIHLFLFSFQTDIKIGADTKKAIRDAWGERGLSL